MRMNHSPSKQGVGPLRATTAHPVQSLRDGLVFRLRGGNSAAFMMLGVAVRISVLVGDITKQKVDVVVNAANSE